MKVKQLFVPLAVMISFVLSCRSAPTRPDFKKNKHAGNVEANPNEPGDPIDPTNPDPIALKHTLDKILQVSGGAEDEACKSEPIQSKRHLRLLNQNEYQNTIRDVLGITDDFRGLLPTDIEVMGFRNNADVGKITDGHANAYLNVAIKLAEGTKAKLPSLAQCSEMDGVSCATKVIDVIAPKLWRRPLEASEKAYLKKLHQTGLNSSASEGMTMLLSGILISPHFLYRSEIGKDSSLTAFELASALSYFFWGTVPDAALTSAAANGSLLNEPVLMAQAERLWADPKSEYASTEFANAWLESKRIRGANKDESKFPTYTQAVRDAMYEEADDTFNHLLRQEKAGFDTLFTNDYTIGSELLAGFYKGQSFQDGNLTKIKFPNSPRKGVLGLGAVLGHLASAVETHPIKRGEFVLKQMFCHIAPPTPAGLDVMIPAQKEGVTTRERFAKHTESPVCAGCHIPIDGIGFGMEDFDAVGLYREFDNGKKVDNSGEIHEVDDKPTKFAGVAELSTYVANSTQARRCFVVQWYRYAHGHTERPADVCAIRDIANKFEKGDLTITQLLVKIVTHQSFHSKGE